VIRGRHRFRLLAKCARPIDMSAFMRAWLARLPAPPHRVRIDVDIDPMSFW
jgi:primosomal protein N' (replication factor Y) (superfamily II helicase)